jgi:hypothetical protein
MPKEQVEGFLQMQQSVGQTDYPEQGGSIAVYLAFSKEPAVLQGAQVWDNNLRIQTDPFLGSRNVTLSLYDYCTTLL